MTQYPTIREYEAFRLVYLYGLNTYEAAEMMGYSQPMVMHWLKQLNNRYPGVCPKLGAPGGRRVDRRLYENLNVVAKL
jgi:predicted transcriptional regulator